MSTQAKITLDAKRNADNDAMVTIHVAGVDSERDATVKQIVKALKKHDAWTPRWVRHYGYAWEAAFSFDDDFTPQSARDVVKALLLSADLKVS